MSERNREIFQLLDESAEAGRRARVHGKSAVRHLRSAASKMGSGKTHRTAITGRYVKRSGATRTSRAA